MEGRPPHAGFGLPYAISATCTCHTNRTCTPDTHTWCATAWLACARSRARTLGSVNPRWSDLWACPCCCRRSVRAAARSLRSTRSPGENLTRRYYSSTWTTHLSWSRTLKMRLVWPAVHTKRSVTCPCVRGSHDPRYTNPRCRGCAAPMMRADPTALRTMQTESSSAATATA